MDDGVVARVEEVTRDVSVLEVYLAGDFFVGMASVRAVTVVVVPEVSGSTGLVGLIGGVLWRGVERDGRVLIVVVVVVMMIMIMMGCRVWEGMLAAILAGKESI